MSNANLYNQAGDKIGEVKLNASIFGLEPNAGLVKQAVVALLANRRKVIADTKTKGEVRGGGIKPWKQKGTGRARHGSIRSPIWKGGGVVFGPTSDRNFTLKLNKQMKKKALFSVLSDKANDNFISVIESFADIKKTKEMLAVLEKMQVEKRTLIVIEKMDQTLVKATRNLPKVEIIAANSLNVLDTMNCKNILFTKEALKKTEDVYLR